MADSTPRSYSSDPALYLYTSLTSGSSHIVTATSRLETILKANRIPFKALDIATDEKARMLWGRRAGKDESGRPRKIPGLVQMGLVIGDLVEIEDWNEYGELKEHVTIVHDAGTPARSAAPTTSSTPSKLSASQESQKPKAATAESSKDAQVPKDAEGPKDTEIPKDAEPTNAEAQPTSFTLVMRQASQEAAQKAKDAKKKSTERISGAGEMEPANNVGKSVAIPPPISTTGPVSPKQNIEGNTILQSPRSTAWRQANPQRSLDILESLQSPNSTAWKPVDTNLPVIMHRGSSISAASAEEIRRIEEEEAIQEEDEEEDTVAS